ncbi:hypothetical protein D3C71_1848470 [compost metagenome]
MLLQQLARDEGSHAGEARVEHQRSLCAIVRHLLQFSPRRSRDGRLRQQCATLPEDLQFGAHLRILDAADHQIHALQGGAQTARHIEVYPAEIFGRLTAPPTP